MDDRCDGDMVWYVKLNWKERKFIYNISLFATILRLQKWVLTINNLLITLIDERFELGGIRILILGTFLKTFCAEKF